MTKRKRLPLRWARYLHKTQGGKCAVAGCEVVLIIGPKGQHVNWVDEHILPLGLGGKNTRKNRELRCIEHAHKKTRRPKSGGIGGDLFEINKAKHVRKKGGLRVRKRQPGKPNTRKGRLGFLGARKMQSRGFDKVRRPFRRRYNVPLRD